MATFRGIVEFIAVVDEIAFGRWFVAVPNTPRAVSLQTVDIQWTTLSKPCGQGFIGRSA
jgi:hypothetical protein